MGYTLTIAYMQETAEERGGKCLSTEYVGLEGVLTWQCAEGHVWEATGRKVRSEKTWCPECLKSKRQKNLKQYATFKHEEKISPTGEKLRVCTVCEIAKPHSEMVKAKGRKDGIRSLCKECSRVISRQAKEKKAAQEGRTMQPYKEKPLSHLTDDELLSYLVKFKEEFGRPPSSVDLDGREGYPHVRTFYRRFTECSNSNRERNWNDILLLAGISPLDNEKVWTAWEYLVTLACDVYCKIKVQTSAKNLYRVLHYFCA